MPIRVDNSKLKGFMTKQIDKQVQFALHRTVNEVAKELQGRTVLLLPTWINLRSSWIQRQVKRQIHKRKTLPIESAVYFSDKAPLAAIMEVGGTLLPKGATITIPTAAANRNKSGNITKANRPRQLLAKPNTFSARIGGKAGIWQRDKKTKQLRLLYSYNARASYGGKNIRFQQLGRVMIGRTFDLTFSKHLDTALRTSK